MSVVTPLVLRGPDRRRLEELGSAAGLAQVRAQIVLLAAQGHPNAEIARRLGVSRPTVIEWRRRYATDGVAGLADLPRSGRPVTVNDAYVVAATLTRPPRRLAREHWSTRALSAEIGVSLAGVCRVWQRWGLKPDRQDQLRLPVSPAIDPWCQEVSGLYLNPPECAIAVMTGQNQVPPTLDDLIRPTTPPSGASAVYAGDELMADMRFVAGRVVDSCPAPQQHELFLDFLLALERRYPGRALRVVFHDDSSLEHPQTRGWLARNPAVKIHRVDSTAMWLRVAELLLYTSMSGAQIPDPLGKASAVAKALRDTTASWGRDAGQLSWVEPIVSPFAARAAR